MNKHFNNWKDYITLLLAFLATSFFVDFIEFIKEKISFKDFYRKIFYSKFKFFSFISFIIFIIFFTLYEILEVI